MKTPMKRTRWTILFACALIACGEEDSSPGDATSGDASGSSGGASSGGNGAGGASSGSSVSSGTGATGGGSLSFEADIWPILTMPRDPPLSGDADSCSGANGCHLAGAGGLVLPDPATAYANLIDAPSTSTLCAGLLLVVASEPDASCFVAFYEQRLRDQLGWVDQAETDVVRAWVDQGAAP